MADRIIAALLRSVVRAVGRALRVPQHEIDQQAARIRVRPGDTDDDQGTAGRK
jgi:hypothetical protein